MQSIIFLKVIQGAERMPGLTFEGKTAVQRPCLVVAFWDFTAQLKTAFLSLYRECVFKSDQPRAETVTWGGGMKKKWSVWASNKVRTRPQISQKLSCGEDWHLLAESEYCAMGATISGSMTHTLNITDLQTWFLSSETMNMSSPSVFSDHVRLLCLYNLFNPYIGVNMTNANFFFF